MDELYRFALITVTIVALVALVIVVAVFCIAIYLREVKLKGSTTLDINNQKLDADISISSENSEQDI